MNLINFNITGFGYVLIAIFILLIAILINVIKDDENKWWK